MRTVMDEAIAWFVRMHSDQRTLADEDRFAQWVKQDVSNANAYADVERVWRASGPEIAPRAIDKQEDTSNRFRFSRRLVAALAASVAVVSVGIVSFMLLRPTTISEGTFATGAGEQRELLLADGSTVTLNTRSEAVIDIERDTRSVRLTRGEARFKVAKDASRPFTVDAGALQVRALGTAFDVRKSDENVAVTLVEGRVEVTPTSLALPSAAMAMPAVLTVGQHLSLDVSSGERSIQPIDLNRADAWLNRQLIFDSLPLAEALAEANRYLDDPIVIDDASLDDIRVSGVVRAGNVDSIIAALESSFPVQAVKDANGRVGLVRRVEHEK